MKSIKQYIHELLFLLGRDKSKLPIIILLFIISSLIDIVSLQKESYLQMYDLNAIAEADAFPLNHNGVPASGALRYSDLVTQYPSRTLRIFDTRFDSVYTLNPNLFVGTVKCTTELIFGV